MKEGRGYHPLKIFFLQFSIEIVDPKEVSYLQCEILFWKCACACVFYSSGDLCMYFEETLFQIDFKKVALKIWRTKKITQLVISKYFRGHTDDLVLPWFYTSVCSAVWTAVNIFVVQGTQGLGRWVR